MDHACKMGLEGIVSKRNVLLRPLAGLAQDEEPGGSSGEARGGRGLGEGEVRYAFTGKL
jgi:hypothetical protein